MNWYDWLLVLHVLSAFAMVGATAAFWTFIVGARRSPRPTAIARALPSANIAIAAGSVGTIVFGVWLTLYLDGYELWDLWILASLILWAVSFETGRRGGADIGAATAQGDDALAAVLRARATMLMLGVSTVAVVVILVLMIWKPGAV